ncbi:MAG: hypothetical protein BAJATHORv1_50123 [Candidatus Thorarchaeota archaeon]|nr:MAG: hypothetical protein BAJATHORv1_50123 [Candidatus Thorarchaeota archaeon]
MRILVTGGAGYLGSILVRRLLDGGHQVRVLDKLLFGNDSLVGLEGTWGFQLYHGDVTNVKDVTAAMNDIDAVIDLAAIVGDPACKINEDLTIQTNYWATHLLAEVAQAKGISKFLFASTCSVYGKSSGSADEDGETNPLSLYAKTKLDSEGVIKKFSNGMGGRVLRLATLCGPSYRMRFDLVLNIMTAKACIDGKVQVFGGEQIRPLLDVRDAAKAFQYLLENSDSSDYYVFNIGSNSSNTSIANLGELVVNTVGNSELTHIPEVSDARSYRVDFSRIKDIGFTPDYSLEDSIHGIVELFKDGTITDYTNPRYHNAKQDYQN